MRRLFSLPLSSFLFSLVLISCADVTLKDKEKDKLSQGRQQLDAGNFDEAQKALREIVQGNPEAGQIPLNPNNSEARFYLFVAQLQGSLNALSTQLGPIIDLLGGSGDSASKTCVPGSPTGTSLFGVSHRAPGSPAVGAHRPRRSTARLQSGELNGLNYLVLSIVKGLLIDQMRSMGDNLRAITEDRDFEIVYDPFPIKLGDTTLIDLGGRFDLGEIHLFIAVTELLEALGHALLTINLDMDLGPILQLVADPCASTDLGSVMNTVVQLLNRSPNFLTLSPVGAGEMRDFVDMTFASVGEIVNAVFVTATQKARPDDFFAIDTRLVLPTDPTCTPAPPDSATKPVKRMCIIIHLKAGDGTPVELGLPLTKDLVVAAAGMGDALFQTCSNRVVDANGKVVMGANGLPLVIEPPGCRISWARHIVPLIANVVPPLLSSGALFAILGPIISGSSAEATVNQLEGVLTDCAPVLNADMLGCTMLKFIPDAIEIDAQALRGMVDATPQGYIRDILPCWTSGSDRKTNGGTYGCHITPVMGETEFIDSQGIVNERFLFESECEANPLTIPSGLVCKSTSNDYAHFDHAVFGRLGIGRIERDGLTSPFPYMPMRDPSIFGLLWLNPGPFGDAYAATATPLAFEVENRYTKATVRDLNLLVAHLGIILGPALGGDVTSAAGPVVECFSKQFGKVPPAQINKCIGSVSVLIPTSL